MKKTFLKIAVVMAICICAPYMSVQSVKADEVSTPSTSSMETKNATVIGVLPLTENLAITILQDDDNGLIYTFYTNTVGTFNIGDKVVVYLEKSGSKGIVRTIIRK